MPRPIVGVGTVRRPRGGVTAAGVAAGALVAGEVDVAAAAAAAAPAAPATAADSAAFFGLVAETAVGCGVDNSVPVSN